MTAVGARSRSFLDHLVIVSRLVILLIALLAMPGSGAAPGEVRHDADQVVSAVPHQLTGTCHQAGHSCPLAIEVVTNESHSVGSSRKALLRPSNDRRPEEFLYGFDTPPPRV